MIDLAPHVKAMKEQRAAIDADLAVRREAEFRLEALRLAASVYGTCPPPGAIVAMAEEFAVFLGNSTPR